MVERVNAAEQDLRKASLQELEPLAAITFGQQSRRVHTPKSVRLIAHWSSYRLTPGSSSPFPGTGVMSRAHKPDAVDHEPLGTSSRNPPSLEFPCSPSLASPSSPME
jgi:hypothetical protein